ncbi:AraC family transcriptional regulator [Parahaliea sp. F7430]|uniref:AraC family transcriptional regulator n=1 Tax=Sediminihaliea albiluteola TaxID=2758564 RepID=A0A7W2YJ41_9GAMM|nr:AraC family transcriptional regulator [Sediminihaliea albiluteola]
MNTDARYIVWLLDQLSSLGLDAEALAANNGISPSQLEGPDQVVTAEQHQGLLRAALAASKNPGLGLELGLRRSLVTLDQFAYLMMSSANLRAATEAGLRYQNYTGRFSGGQIIISFSEAANEGCYQIYANPSLGDLRLLAIEDVLTNILTTCRWILGKDLPLSRLNCDYPSPPHAERYSEIFDCPLQFDAPHTELFFEASILDEPLPHSSPHSAKLYEKLCEEKSIERNRGDVAWRLWQMVVRDPSQPPTLEAAASELHYSARTLSRKLQAQGWQYQELVDRVREIQARRFLSDPRLSLSEVAQKVGYADSSGFNRAFKKWTGHTPKAYRDALFAR